MRLLAHDRSQSFVNTARKWAMALAIGLMVGAMVVSPSATPAGMLYQGDVFRLVVKLRTVALFESLTSAQRVQITTAVQHHRDAIRTAPTEEQQLAAAISLISDVAGILTPAQRAELARTMNRGGSGTRQATSANP